MSKSDFNLGQKIRMYRERAGLSQMELELEIGASPGSLSRIENGQTNPSKETIYKVSEALELSAREIKSLFEIDNSDIREFSEATYKVSSSLDLQEVLQNSVDNLSKELGLLGAGIYLVKGNEIVAQTQTRTWWTEKMESILGRPYNSFRSKFSNTENLIVSCIVENREIETSKVYGLTKNVVADYKAKLIQAFMHIGSGIVMPICIEGIVIGAIYFGKDNESGFENEKEILRSFTLHIAAAINNALKYQELNERLKAISI